MGGSLGLHVGALPARRLRARQLVLLDLTGFQVCQTADCDIADQDGAQDDDGPAPEYPGRECQAENARPHAGRCASIPLGVFWAGCA